MFSLSSTLQSVSKHFLDDSVSVVSLVSSMTMWPPNNPQGVSTWNSASPRLAYSSLQRGLDACIHTHLAMPCQLCQPPLGAGLLGGLLYTLEVTRKKTVSAPAVDTQLCKGWSTYLRQSTGIALSDPTFPTTVL